MHHCILHFLLKNLYPLLMIRFMCLTATFAATQINDYYYYYYFKEIIDSQ